MKVETGLPLATKRVYTTGTLICQLYYQNAVHFYTQSLPGDLTNSNTSGFGLSGENWVCSMGSIPELPWSKKE
jgi:hypothetical protein